jgi:hypothetical protein
VATSHGKQALTERPPQFVLLHWLTFGDPERNLQLPSLAMENRFQRSVFVLNRRTVREYAQLGWKCQERSNLRCNSSGRPEPAKSSFGRPREVHSISAPRPSLPPLSASLL